MNGTTSSENWLQKASMRLQADGFVVLPQESYQSERFRFAVRRSRFEVTKFGYAETFFVFADLPRLTPQQMASFSNAAFEFAVKSRRMPLPPGIFGSVWSFAVAITENLDAATAQSIRSVAPPKHLSAAEISAAYDTATGSLYYFEGTPVWGGAYFNGFRQQIRTYMGS